MSCAGSAVRRSPASSCATRPTRRRAAGIAGQLGEILARIHATDLATLPPLARREAADHIAGLRRQLDLLGQPQPVFELALAWLDRRKPAPTPRTVLVHGDYRTGNYLADESGVTAILDWEGAHLGDPVEDLGWLCVKSWRFGAVDKPAAGFGSREELWTAYERAGGGKVDPARAHWWEVFGTARWGIICHNQAFRHLSGSIKSMELASIGRRAVETEVDLLQLLKSGGRLSLRVAPCGTTRPGGALPALTMAQDPPPHRSFFQPSPTSCARRRRRYSIAPSRGSASRCGSR